MDTINEKLEHVSSLAVKALLYELALSPKPGLVDRYDTGAHDDMDFYTFTDSIMALEPFFRLYIQTGWTYHNEAPHELFHRLRLLGLKAESAMFAATHGINTHKGVNFSLALLLGATGAYLAKHPHLLQEKTCFSSADTQAVCTLAADMTKELVEEDLSHLEKKSELTHGERLFLEHGIKGPRGEAAGGYASLTQKALPFLRQELAKGKDHHTVQLQLLLYLMTFVEDGNLIHRGGIAAWKTVKEESKSLLETTPSADLPNQMTVYNQKLIERHLSPGGSADLLSLTFYFAFLENLL
ncbi:triphosphoribosyl-dephospho-CoA synthase CitG [Streptococcus caviae]|uniref:triphosphoribosyl-dephospho-CoA synthase CitG n=1 Tax=Streptococcus sp. 'caviae' TaxID=1915004 RepID=UPI00094B9F0C|nr:triphosphoribosyl-dephospho-CoA synthase CitG [Streptococcus sp. 'caviae']OLN83962.1 triphosphoribosyl-dephospho-CoA synthase CitG [Streptococcus sp. 'caviae']